MKIYECKLWPKILMILGSAVVLTCVFVIYFYDLDNSYIIKCFAPLALFLSVGGVVALYKTKYIVDDKKIQLHGFKIREVSWEEITRVETDYYFVPQLGILKIILSSKSKQKYLQIFITFFDKKLLKDILSNINPDVEVEIYPWLNKMLAIS